MTTKAGTLELIARELGQVLAPLEQRLTGGGALELLGAVGVRLPDSMASHAQVVSAITGAATHAAALAPKVAQLAAAITADDEAQIVSSGIAVVDGAGKVLGALRDLSQALQTAAATLTPAERAALQPLIADIGRRLFDFLVIEHFENESLPAVQALTLLGVIDRVFVPGDAANPMAVPFTRRELRIDRLGDLLSNPLLFLETTYRFGASDFDGLLLFRRIKDFLDAYDYPVVLLEPPGHAPILEAYLVAMEPVPTSPPSLGLKFRFKATEDFDREFDIRDPWSFRLSAKARFAAGMEGSITPPFDVQLTPPGGQASVELTADLVGDAGGTPMTLLGKAGSTRLEATKIAAGFGFKTEFDGTRANGEPVVRAEVRGGKLFIDLSEGDGFIQTILNGVRVESAFELGARWTPGEGVRFEGGAGIELVVPLHRSLGPVEIQTLYFLLGFAADPPISVGVAAAIGVQIGPFDMSVDKIGVDVPLRFPAERNGNLGAVDLAFTFRPPTGAGLVIDAPVVLGGGYLHFDPQKEEYGGILQLEIAETIAVKAVGLLITRMPDGAKGYSLLITITAQGFAPIQLGYGFTLTGIGGLLAINRTFDEEALRAGLKNHTLDSVLFPKDPIRNAPQILSNLNRVFPPANGHHLFGPMVQIAWGTPALITADVGVVLEFGARLRLLILGQVVAILPKRENDLVRLQMDAIGVLDFDQGTAALDATLHDSRLLKKFVLTGDMAMRLKWEPSPNFALAVGGLHPAFNPPPGFPKIERIALNLSAGDNPRFRCESYFALTANTVQFGARAELYAAASGFSIQGETGYDVLIQLDPFYFLADFYAQLQLKRGSTNLFKVRVEGALAGPRPLHIKAKATFEVLWWDVSIRIDRTLVEGEKPPPPEPVDVLPRLKEALGNPGNWMSQLPDGQRPMVTLRAKPGAATEVLLHPLGTLTVKQGVVPLNMDISRFGQAAPAGARRFTITSVRLGGQNQTTRSVKEFFAPAQFFEMSDDEKLSRPSFEPMAAGVGIGSDEIAFTADANDWLEVQAIEFETIIVDKQRRESRHSDPKNLYKLTPVLLGKQARFGAAGNSDLRRTGKAKYRTTMDKHRIEKEGWSIVATDDLTVQAVTGIEAGPTIYSEAAQALRKLKQENPAKAAGLTILRLSELL